MMSLILVWLGQTKSELPKIPSSLSGVKRTQIILTMPRFEETGYFKIYIKEGGTLSRSDRLTKTREGLHMKMPVQVFLARHV
jgi:hypothetical protein